MLSTKELLQKEQISSQATVYDSCDESLKELVDPRATKKIHNPMDLVDLAKQIQQADELILANATNKLTVIAEQVRMLTEKARDILEDAQRDNELHHTKCNFKKVPGNTYHLYSSAVGNVLSMLSPEDWGARCPYEYIDSYRLEADRSWTPISKLQSREKEIANIQTLFANPFSLPLTYTQ